MKLELGPPGFFAHYEDSSVARKVYNSYLGNIYAFLIHPGPVREAVSGNNDADGLDIALDKFLSGGQQLSCGGEGSAHSVSDADANGAWSNVVRAFEGR